MVIIAIIMEIRQKYEATCKSSLNCKGRLLDLSKPLVMGILNSTPDSFFDGGVHNNLQAALNQCERMLAEGADLLDIGGQSSRPGAQVISAEEEKIRVIPIIEAINRQFPEAILSVDTFYASVAKESIEAGATIVNDITAGEQDEAMLETVAALKVPYCLMHKKGPSATMQDNPSYDHVLKEVFDYLYNRVKQCHAVGIEQLIIDPGFGFGKTMEHNYTLLKNLNYFSMLDVPILVGLSRKSMIYKALNSSPQEALNGTTALNMAALLKGASILRVHDVKEAKECVELFTKFDA